MKCLSVCTVLVLLLLTGGMSGVHAEEGFILLGSTVGPVDAGIVTALEEVFEKEAGIRVRHVGAGTRAAVKIAEKGNVDLVMINIAGGKAFADFMV